MNKQQPSRGSIHRIIIGFIIVMTGLFMNACQNSPDDFILGEEFIESKTNLSKIDTFSVAFSTIIFDEINTSGTGSILIGNYQDDTFGKISSHSFFQLGIPSDTDIQDDETYDSLSLILTYNGYSFGDTTKIQKISVHQLAEQIEYNDDDIITSTTSFNFDPNPIGSIIYTPEPTCSDDTIAIKISDTIGLDLFTRLKNEDNIFTDITTFQNYFNGLTLRADDAYEGSIVGFEANASEVRLVLYTSREGETEIEEINYVFSLVEPAKQFNQIIHDFASTELLDLVGQRYELSSTKTSDQAYIHGGIGLAIRVDFPSLSELMMFDRGQIAEARLTIHPSTTLLSDFDLPEELYVYESDKLNNQNDVVLTNESAYATSVLNQDDLYPENTTYVFDITKYLIDELDDSYVDPEKGLLMMLPQNDMEAGLNRLIMDAKNKHTKARNLLFILLRFVFDAEKTSHTFDHRHLYFIIRQFPRCTEQKLGLLDVWNWPNHGQQLWNQSLLGRHRDSFSIREIPELFESRLLPRNSSELADVGNGRLRDLQQFDK